MVDLPSGIRLPAAQVQDRGQCRGAGPRGDSGARYRPRPGQRRARRNRLPVFVGGGLGRTPILGKLIREFLPRRHLLSYLDAILRLYNRYGRRDNMYKARIKILVQALGIEEFARQVEAEWSHLRDGPTTVTDAEFARIAGISPRRLGDAACRRPAHAARLTPTGFRQLGQALRACAQDAGLRRRHPVAESAGRRSRRHQRRADDRRRRLADRFSFGELRVSHEQNVVLADVKQRDLHELWQSPAASAWRPPTSAC
jgi:sulfite reductase (NADPH) hemoprotein beta-component